MTGQHGGYSRLGPSCGQRRSCCGRPPRPCGRVAVPVPPGTPSHTAGYSACAGALSFLTLSAPLVPGRVLHLVQRLFFRENRGGRRVVHHAVNHVVILFGGLYFSCMKYLLSFLMGGAVLLRGRLPVYLCLLRALLEPGRDRRFLSALRL